MESDVSLYQRVFCGLSEESSFFEKCGDGQGVEITSWTRWKAAGLHLKIRVDHLTSWVKWICMPFIFPSFIRAIIRYLRYYCSTLSMLQVSIRSIDSEFTLTMIFDVLIATFRVLNIWDVIRMDCSLAMHRMFLISEDIPL